MYKIQGFVKRINVFFFLIFLFEFSTIPGHVSDVRDGKFYLLPCEKLPVKCEAPCLYKPELELIHLYFWNALIKRKISKLEAKILH